jgi:hypothetical protein
LPDQLQVKNDQLKAIRDRQIDLDIKLTHDNDSLLRNAEALQNELAQAERSVDEMRIEARDRDDRNVDLLQEIERLRNHIAAVPQDKEANTQVGPIASSLGKQKMLQAISISPSPLRSPVERSLLDRSRSGKPLPTVEVERRPRPSMSVEIRSEQSSLKRHAEVLIAGEERGNPHARSSMSNIADRGPRRASHQLQEALNVDIAQARIGHYEDSIPLDLRTLLTSYIEKRDERNPKWTMAQAGIYCLHCRAASKPTTWTSVQGVPNQEHACRDCKYAGRRCVVMGAGGRVLKVLLDH